MRRFTVAIALAAAGVSAGVAHATGDDSQLTYGCDPPLPRATANCVGWHTSPVTLTWSFDTLNFVPVPGLPGNDCDQQVFDTDTAGASVKCTVWSIVDGTHPANALVTILVDQTPPTVTGFMPARPADKDG